MAKLETRYKRILLKLSGEALAGDAGFGIDPKVLDRMSLEFKQTIELGVQVGMVIGGGNLFRGALLNAAGLERVTGDHMGMLATVINAMALQDKLEQYGIHTRVMSAIRMQKLAEPYIRRRALRHLEKGRVVIFAGGTGNPYFSTDTAAVLRGIEMEADVILKATKVDGVFTADPESDPNAEFIDKISYLEVMTRELGVMDAAAISLCKENELPLVVLNIKRPGAILAALKGEKIGTLVA